MKIDWTGRVLWVDNDVFLELFYIPNRGWYTSKPSYSSWLATKHIERVQKAFLLLTERKELLGDKVAEGRIKKLIEALVLFEA